MVELRKNELLDKGSTSVALTPSVFLSSCFRLVAIQCKRAKSFPFLRCAHVPVCVSQNKRWHLQTAISRFCNLLITAQQMGSLRIWKCCLKKHANAHNMHAWMYLWMYVCMCVCIYVCIYICIYIYTDIERERRHITLYMFRCLLYCMCIYVYLHAYMFLWILQYGRNLLRIMLLLPGDPATCSLTDWRPLLTDFEMKNFDGYMKRWPGVFFHVQGHQWTSIYIYPITSNSQLGSFVRDSPIFCESHRTVLV